MRKALFPISIDSNLFTTAFVTAALEPLCRNHTSILFLVADCLHIYNKAGSVTGPFELEQLLWDSPIACKRYVDERRNWLRRIRSALGQEATLIEWQAVGASRFIDRECYAIYRRLLLAFHTLESFRHDVIAVAERHLDRNDIDGEKHVKERLSEAYVLEEIALNLRVRVPEGIEEEYYIGEYPEPLLGIYGGKYNVSLSSLVGSPVAERQFRFFSPLRYLDTVRWKAVSTKSG